MLIVVVLFFILAILNNLIDIIDGEENIIILGLFQLYATTHKSFRLDRILILYQNEISIYPGIVHIIQFK